MRILCLDIATCTGYAFSADGAPPVYGSYRMGSKTCDLEERFVAMFEWLNEKIDELAPNVLVYEAPILTKTDSVELMERLVGLASVAAMVGRKRGLKVYKASGDTVTRTFTGSARYPGTTRNARRAAKKAAVVATCRLRGWSPQDDNAADGLALLSFAESIFNRQQAVDRAAGPLFADGRRP